MSDELKPILWGPRDGKSLLAEYPDIGEYKEFKELSREELNFVWYVGNPSSPLNGGGVLDEKIKYKSAAARCIRDPEKKKRLGEGDIPSGIREAIAKMQTFSPEARAIAKQVATTAFHNLQAMVNIDVESDFKITRSITSGTGKDKTIENVEEMDWAGRKQYVDTVAKISDLLPSLLKQVEHGFGVEEKNDKELGMKSIDKFHQSNQEN